jgi:Ser/Thr protein kinase RdoA (MazF antagonist)
MKVAEALALHADAARRVEQLRARIAASARYQEGEAPAEDTATLLAETGEVLGELESLIRRINRTNAATLVEGGTATWWCSTRISMSLAPSSRASWVNICST